MQDLFEEKMIDFNQFLGLIANLETEDEDDIDGMPVYVSFWEKGGILNTFRSWS